MRTDAYGGPHVRQSGTGRLRLSRRGEGSRPHVRGHRSTRRSRAVPARSRVPGPLGGRARLRRGRPVRRARPARRVDGAARDAAAPSVRVAGRRRPARAAARRRTGRAAARGRARPGGPAGSATCRRAVRPSPGRRGEGASEPERITRSGWTSRSPPRSVAPAPVERAGARIGCGRPPSFRSTAAWGRRAAVVTLRDDGRAKCTRPGRRTGDHGSQWSHYSRVRSAGEELTWDGSPTGRTRDPGFAPGRSAGGRCGSCAGRSSPSCCSSAPRPRCSSASR